MPKPALALSLSAAVLALAGCTKGAEQGPTPQVTPEAILFPDITDGKLYGSGCNFVPSDEGMGAYALALDKHAWIKLAGKIVTLDPDTTSAPMPKKGWSRYTGEGYTLTLGRAAGSADKQAGVVDMLKGSLTLADAKGQVVYKASGDIQCKPM
ncbi:MAG: hypothetical protein KGL48_09925 [Sphingomonadales bacterium]|nr:hypothetical protein [Sphingomonadales bacterium]MDE2570112.1 hypothetical protein [Sphingomonadales bacterium]